MKEPSRAEEVLDRRSEMLRLRDEINRVSDELAHRITDLCEDIFTTRNDPEIRSIWNRLCRLHMKAMVSCEYDPTNQEEIVKLCEELSKPRACVELLCLSEEQTCCARFLHNITQ